VHLTLLAVRLWSTLGRLENAFCSSFEQVEEFTVADRTADGLGTAQPRDHVDIGLLRQEVLKIQVALANRSPDCKFSALSP
jgi:hypothetical protein